MNNNTDILNQLKSTWQQHSEQIERIVQQHDPSCQMPIQSVKPSSSKHESRVALAVAILCLALVAIIIVLSHHLVADFVDFLVLLLFTIGVIIVGTQKVLQFIALQRPDAHLPIRYASLSPRQDMLHNATIPACIIVMIFYLTFPTLNIQAMRPYTPVQHQATIEQIDATISHC